METYKINTTDINESVGILPLKIVSYFTEKFNLTHKQEKELYEAIEYYKYQLKDDIKNQLDKNIETFKHFL